MGVILIRIANLMKLIAMAPMIRVLTYGYYVEVASREWGGGGRSSAKPRLDPRPKTSYTVSYM